MLFDSGILELEEQFCIRCGNLGDLKTCVACKADEAGASTGATAVMLYKDEEGNVTNVEQVWVH